LLDRSRTTQLSLAAACFGLFALLAVAFKQEWAVFVDLDDQSRRWRDWVDGSSWLGDPLRWVELGFSNVGMVVLTTILAVAMFAKGYRRAAAFTAGVMIAIGVATNLLKLWLGRERPLWQSEEYLLDTNAFPSGHASSTAAFAGVVMVLVAMLVRRANLRRLVYAGMVVVVLLVAADRVLLGRHYITDVSAGVLLGAGFVLLGIALYNPLPRSHAEKIEPLPEAVPTQKKLAVILNPVKVEDVGQFQAIVSAMAVEAGWSPPSWLMTTVEDPGTGQAYQAAVSGADLVIVCGGDGTVREVCAELAGTGIPVGIVPAGTGNLLARNLDIPLYVRAAIDVALTGQDRAIDMVAVRGDGLDDTHFMVMAGMGFDAAIMEGVNEDIKKKVGWLAYVWSALKSLMFPVTKVEISIDGADPTTHRARTIVVGNVGYLQAGMPLLPDATIDDGQLDVVILYPRRFLSWLPIVYRVLAKRPRTDDTINRMTGRTVSIKAAGDTPRQLDGDSVGTGQELHMECIHGRLLVRVPR
jgi:YegS/Rv2252/BmrU family lipid kinase